jgi:cytochrome b subunit of formate dehydrogenase
MRPVEKVSVHTGPNPNLLTRYSTGERLTHWGVAIAYVALFLSGLALFHPFFFWLSAVFGGAAFMRVLHPFLGVAFASCSTRTRSGWCATTSSPRATAAGSPRCSGT